MSLQLDLDLQEALGPSYVVGRELGGGGMSRVFQVEELSLGRTIVVKVLSPDLVAGVSLERFKREIALTARLQHPHIVPIFAAGEVAGLPYYTMPYVAGDSLRSLLRRSVTLQLRETLSILQDVARALEHAHGSGVVHRDIKPENVLLAGRSAVVSLSTGSGDALTSVGLSLGTPAYMAPEQAAADPDTDHRADLYTFGVMAYEMLAGNTPFGHRAARAIIAAHVLEAPPPLGERRPDLPDAVTELVMRLLEKDPADRPQTATEVLQALEEIQSGTASSRRPTPERQQAATDLTIAVLPFRRQGGSEDAEHLSDGIAEEIINSLARNPSLRVVARSSSFALREQVVDLAEVGRKLNANRLVDGTLRQAGKRVRVTAQLNDVVDGLQIWSEKFDREMDDFFELQDEIAGAISSALKVALFNSRGDIQPARKRTSDLEAYDLYLKGRFFLNQRVDGMWKAMEYYERALQRDPQFALAHAGVAEGYFLLIIYSAISPGEGAPRARDAALRALELDASLAEAEIVLSNYALWYAWDTPEAMKRLSRAMELKPSDALAHSCLAYCYASEQEHERSLDQARRAVAIDPLGIFAVSNLAVMQYLARQFEESIATCGNILEIAPNNSEAHRWMALSHFHLGQWKEAFASIDLAVTHSNRHHWPLANLGAMLARAKKRDKAVEILEELRQRATGEHIPPLAFATLHYGLGQLDECFAELERSVEARDFWLFMLRADPGFAALQADPRFEQIAAQLKPLSQAH
jgi:eukaryotic-like serine/threonine-protein kinase